MLADKPSQFDHQSTTVLHFGPKPLIIRLTKYIVESNFPLSIDTHKIN